MRPNPVARAASLLAAVLTGTSAAPAAEQPAWEKQTIAYKTVGPTVIEADVFRRNGDRPRPCVVWIHGGALIMGSRGGVPRDIRQLCEEQNYVLVSLDYGWRRR